VSVFFNAKIDFTISTSFQFMVVSPYIFIETLLFLKISPLVSHFFLQLCNINSGINALGIHHFRANDFSIANADANALLYNFQALAYFDKSLNSFVDLLNSMCRRKLNTNTCFSARNYRENKSNYINAFF